MKFKNYNFNFIGKRKIWFIISLTIIVAGIVGFIIQGGFNLGIDFLGGSLMEVEFERDVDVAEVRGVMNDIGFGNAILQQTESNRFIIRTTPMALVHDVLVTLGVYAILSREINTSTIAALLTIIGYSLNDTIVVFDRIRENTPKAGKLGYSKVVNDSVNITLTRSINTTLTTLFPVILLLILGTAALKDFALALTIGIITGTYSSIFFASPVLVAWNNKFPRYKK